MKTGSLEDGSVCSSLFLMQQKHSILSLYIIRWIEYFAVSAVVAQQLTQALSDTEENLGNTTKDHLETLAAQSILAVGGEKAGGMTTNTNTHLDSNMSTTGLANYNAPGYGTNLISNSSAMSNSSSSSSIYRINTTIATELDKEIYSAVNAGVFGVSTATAVPVLTTAVPIFIKCIGHAAMVYPAQKQECSFVTEVQFDYFAVLLRL